MLQGGKSDLEKIKKAARDNPTSSKLLYYLAHGYREFGEYVDAAREFEEAAAKAEEEAERLAYLSLAAVQYAKAERWDR